MSRVTPPLDSDVARYLEMERDVYAHLVARSRFADESFTARDDAEFVVGTYAAHERFDYERWLFGGVCVAPAALALDYGCGPGRMILRLTPTFYRIDGVDISPEVIEVARRRCHHLPRRPNLLVTDGQSVPSDPEEIYDVAYSVICLQHICVHAVRSRIFAALYRALKPGGLLTFQMGYGPGHPSRIGYAADFIAASGTNGANDVMVLHPAELAGDLGSLGFEQMAYALTPTGPGDKHAAWIFFRAVKPGDAAALSWSEATWAAAGFEGISADSRRVAAARNTQWRNGLLAQSLRMDGTIASLRQQLADMTADRDHWRSRALAGPTLPE
jgi:SAM-dependent methyltransferase